MVPTLAALCFDAQDPSAVGRFWAAVLQRRLADDVDGTILLPNIATEFPIRFRPADQPRTTRNRFHFDLTSSSLDDQQRIVALARDNGATDLDVGQTATETHVVLADPEGNEFCVIEPGNNFLADTAAIGGLAGDGTQRVGYFWRDAVEWPLVWDQDEETAIQSPLGGTKITWGGPPVAAKAGVARLRFELSVPDGDLETAADRLLQLGASRLSTDAPRPHDVVGGVVLADPDGNEFSLRTVTAPG